MVVKSIIFLALPKNTENDKEAVPSSTVDDGPGDGFTILSAKSLFLGQKVHVTGISHNISVCFIGYGCDSIGANPYHT